MSGQRKSTEFFEVAEDHKIWGGAASGPRPQRGGLGQNRREFLGGIMRAIAVFTVELY